MSGRGRFPTFNGRESNCRESVKLPVWLPALLLPITWATDVQMINARPFWTSMLQDLSNDTKNTSMRGVLGLTFELQKFGSPGGFQVPNFGECEFHPHTWPKWGCDIFCQCCTQLLKWIEIFVKRVFNPPQFFLWNFCAMLLTSSPPRLGTKSETYNVLPLECLSHVEPNTLVIVPFKPFMKLRLGFGIMP
jgi:hypothetical protein